MNTVSIHPPDYVLDAMRLSNSFYLLIYGLTPYPPQRQQ